MGYYEIYVFSTYWVCTVITTVGYGDYSGGTTLEYQVTLFLELFGMVLFATLQMAVTRIINSKYHFDNYINEKEAEIDMWLLRMENSTKPYYYPGELFKTLKQTALNSIKNDYNMIIEEYGCWEKLPTSYQSSIVEVLLGEMVRELQPILVDCERSFVNNFVVSFAHRCYHAGKVV